MAPPIAPRKSHSWDRPTGPTDDPYAWLSDRDDPDTIAYLQAENAFTAEWTAPHAELIETIFGEIKSRVQETDVAVPARKDDWWYVSRTVEGENYPIHCRGRSAETATEQVLLDENVEAGSGDYFALGSFDVSPSHAVLAYSVDLDGGEEYELRFRDLATGSDLADRVERTYYGSAWAAGSDWFFYTRPDEAMRPFQVWRHQLGTAAADDVLVLQEDDERFFLDVALTRDETFVVIHAESKLTSESWVVPAAQPTAAPTSLLGRRDGHEYSVEHWGDRWVILTNDAAEDFRVVTAAENDPTTWSELVAHTPGRRITAAEPFAGHLVIHEWADARQQLRVLFATGEQRPIDLGEVPAEVELGNNPEYHTSVLRFTYQSLAAPRTVFEEDVVSHRRTLLKQTPVLGVDLTRYTSERLWATTADGAKVPVDIVRSLDTALDGTAPALLYGYGTYEVSIPPYFSIPRLSLLDRGWVFALAHPRGGGELGRRWYLDGKLLAKRNTFTDFLACAAALVEAKIAAPGRVAARGGSAGGLLVGAAMTIQPDAFAAVNAEVPFVDVINSMSDPNLPLTITEWEEWGDPRTEPYASYMLGYSPYDNVAATDYPALWVSAGLNDPRVAYHEPAKWVAKLRATATGSRPVLLKTEMGAGHGGPSGRYDAWRDEATVLAFFITQV